MSVQRPANTPPAFFVLVNVIEVANPTVNLEIECEVQACGCMTSKVRILPDDADPQAKEACKVMMKAACGAVGPFLARVAGDVLSARCCPLEAAPPKPKPEPKPVRPPRRMDA